MLNKIIPIDLRGKFENFYNDFFSTNYHDSYGNYLAMHQKYLETKLDLKTITATYGPVFLSKWNNKEERHNFVEGKNFLSKIRGFIKTTLNKSLTDEQLVQLLTEEENKTIKDFINIIFQIDE